MIGVPNSILWGWDFAEFRLPESLAKIFAGVRGGSSPPAGFGAAPQGFDFELKQKSFIAYGGLGAKPPRFLLAGHDVLPLTGGVCCGKVPDSFEFLSSPAMMEDHENSRYRPDL
ncbi:MAG: hypothetical protein HW380_570 [Magnetococcales bacterium]|nr:hypothetical protein [Magnetococcales bacterium]